MEIKYTPHAEIEISKRMLSKNQIESALKNPNKILDGKEGRKMA